MKSYSLLALLNVLVTIELGTATNNKEKGVNIALETVLEFHRRDVKQDTKIIDNVQRILTRIKNVINNRAHSRRMNSGVNEYLFTEFLEDFINVLQSFEDKDLKEFFTVFDEEIRKYHYKGSKVHEIVQNSDLRIFISKIFEILKNMSTKNVREEMSKFLKFYQSRKKKRSQGGLLEFLDNLYRTGDSTTHMMNFLEQLQYYKNDLNSTVITITKIIRGGLRNIVFDKYSNLSTNARKDVKNSLETYWNEFNNKPNKFESADSNKNQLKEFKIFKYTNFTPSFGSQDDFNDKNGTKFPLFIDIPKSQIPENDEKPVVTKNITVKRFNHITLYPREIKVQTIRPTLRSEYSQNTSTDVRKGMNLWTEERVTTIKQLWDDDYEKEDTVDGGKGNVDNDEYVTYNIDNTLSHKIKKTDSENDYSNNDDKTFKKKHKKSKTKQDANLNKKLDKNLKPNSYKKDKYKKTEKNTSDKSIKNKLKKLRDRIPKKKLSKEDNSIIKTKKSPTKKNPKKGPNTSENKKYNKNLSKKSKKPENKLEIFETSESSLDEKSYDFSLLFSKESSLNKEKNKSGSIKEDLSMNSDSDNSADDDKETSENVKTLKIPKKQKDKNKSNLIKADLSNNNSGFKNVKNKKVISKKEKSVMNRENKKKHQKIKLTAKSTEEDLRSKSSESKELRSNANTDTKHSKKVKSAMNLKGSDKIHKRTGRSTEKSSKSKKTKEIAIKKDTFKIATNSKNEIIKHGEKSLEKRVNYNKDSDTESVTLKSKRRFRINNKINEIANDEKNSKYKKKEVNSAGRKKWKKSSVTKHEKIKHGRAKKGKLRRMMSSSPSSDEYSTRTYVPQRITLNTFRDGNRRNEKNHNTSSEKVLEKRIDNIEKELEHVKHKIKIAAQTNRPGLARRFKVVKDGNSETSMPKAETQKVITTDVATTANEAATKTTEPVTTYTEATKTTTEAEATTTEDEMTTTEAKTMKTAETTQNTLPTTTVRVDEEPIVPAKKSPITISQAVTEAAKFRSYLREGPKIVNPKDLTQYMNGTDSDEVSIDRNKESAKNLASLNNLEINHGNTTTIDITENSTVMDKEVNNKIVKNTSNPTKGHNHKKYMTTTASTTKDPVTEIQDKTKIESTTKDTVIETKDEAIIDSTTIETVEETTKANISDSATTESKTETNSVTMTDSTIKKPVTATTTIPTKDIGNFITTATDPNVTYTPLVEHEKSVREDSFRKMFEDAKRRWQEN